MIDVWTGEVMLWFTLGMVVVAAFQQARDDWREQRRRHREAVEEYREAMERLRRGGEELGADGR